MLLKVAYIDVGTVLSVMFDRLVADPMTRTSPQTDVLEALVTAKRTGASEKMRLLGSHLYQPFSNSAPRIFDPPLLAFSTATRHGESTMSPVPSLDNSHT